MTLQPSLAPETSYQKPSTSSSLFGSTKPFNRATKPLLGVYYVMPLLQVSEQDNSLPTLTKIVLDAAFWKQKTICSLNAALPGQSGSPLHRPCEQTTYPREYREFNNKACTILQVLHAVRADLHLTDNDDDLDASTSSLQVTTNQAGQGATLLQHMPQTAPQHQQPPHQQVQQETQQHHSDVCYSDAAIQPSRARHQLRQAGLGVLIRHNTNTLRQAIHIQAVSVKAADTLYAETQAMHLATAASTQLNLHQTTFCTDNQTLATTMQHEDPILTWATPIYFCHVPPEQAATYRQRLEGDVTFR
ncbi:hypothetical protein HU200_021960 [Digitaria exilis]|uniref:Uncharacterized protein n=1 Tax=Digitaria exilis TaxID=1010633 RepID=A0A835C377_9POAL|nr:hypothetical protein HU200_021960 [Digitaria exilis]